PPRGTQTPGPPPRLQGPPPARRPCLAESAPGASRKAPGATRVRSKCPEPKTRLLPSPPPFAALCHRTMKTRIIGPDPEPGKAFWLGPPKLRMDMDRDKHRLNARPRASVKRAVSISAACLQWLQGRIPL